MSYRFCETALLKITAEYDTLENLYDNHIKRVVTHYDSKAQP